jgi:hypothetical protein
MNNQRGEVVTGVMVVMIVHVDLAMIFMHGGHRTVMITTALSTNKNIVKKDIIICMRAMMLQSKTPCPPQRKIITDSIKHFRKRRWIVYKTSLRRKITRPVKNHGEIQSRCEQFYNSDFL